MSKKHATEFEKIIKEGTFANHNRLFVGILPRVPWERHGPSAMGSIQKTTMRMASQKLIPDRAGRERKKNEDLAARIFNRDGKRRNSAPLKSNVGGSLASRVGVKKRVSSAARIPPGNVDGAWTHDLHGARPVAQRPAPNSLAARIHAPGTTLPRSRPAAPAARANRTARLANAFDRTASSPSNAHQQMNVQAPQPIQRGITIRGLAGPFAVMAQNFAPGTTAADIESAMTPVGGLVSSCRLVKTHPIVIAEIVFESKEGADSVIATFHNQTADGRTLHVYLKPGGSSYNPPLPPPTGPRSHRTNETRAGDNSVLVDGSMGFDDPMDHEAVDQRDLTGSYVKGGTLYSDKLYPRNSSSNDNYSNGSGSRRGRGFRPGR
ncbi:Uu.00g004820.m01.CDS01 [Anthostomella pinea]|uniref:Uu.00g004820.m01.CDS01 n=1 Tax=Anthostomella pinea TaxID=933095 RepID=A0AAI8VKM4_9PEZI|nr:Uu.00g004820.m01.CDS01 [Anthostomella pinea]